MPAYASVEDLEKRLTRELTAKDKTVCASLLEDAGVLIDAYKKDASAEAKKLVSCRMVARAIGNSDMDVPIGANQASQSGLGYSSSWTISGGGAGELYISKTERQLLGGGDSIGFGISPLEGMACVELT